MACRAAIVLLVSLPSVSSEHVPLAGGFFWLCTTVLAVLFACLVMMPSFLQRFDQRYPYQGIHILGPDAEVYYAARVREVYDGFPSLGNTFFSAPKDQPALQPSLPELTIAYAGMTLGFNSLQAFLAAKVVLAIAVFMLFTLLLLLVTGRPWVSLFATVAALEAGALLAAPWDWPLFLHPASASLEFLRFSRAVNPQWTVTFFLIELILLALWVQSGRRLPLLLSALFSCTLIYSYLYAWTYFFAVVGVLFLWFAGRGDRRRVMDLTLFWVIVAVIAIPYVVHLSLLSGHPWYTDTSRRLGLVLRHGPVILSVWNAVFIGFALATRTLWPRKWPLLPAVALAGFVAFNQQIITGHSIVPHHYNWYFIQPLASIFVCAFALSLLPYAFLSRRLRVVMCVLFVLLCTSVASVQQWVAYQGIREYWGNIQHMAPVIAYADQTLRPGQVVYSQDVAVLNIVPVATGADVYFAGNATLALTSDDRARYTYFMDLWLQGVTSDDAARDFPTVRRFMLSSRLHAIYYREAAGDYTRIPDEEVSHNVELYREFFALSLKEKLSRYPMSAVITTPDDPENPVWSAFLRCSTEVFSENGYTLRLLIPAVQQGSCF